MKTLRCPGCREKFEVESDQPFWCDECTQRRERTFVLPDGREYELVKKNDTEPTEKA